MKKWFINIIRMALEKKYTYGSEPFTGAETEVSAKLKTFIDSKPGLIPIDISICPSRLSGAVIAILIYKVEVKSEA